MEWLVASAVASGTASVCRYICYAKLPEESKAPVNVFSLFHQQTNSQIAHSHPFYVLIKDRMDGMAGVLKLISIRRHHDHDVNKGARMAEMRLDGYIPSSWASQCTPIRALVDTATMEAPMEAA